MHQIISVLSQACDAARKKFDSGEQKMLLDIFNGTLLTPGILGQHIVAQVEDSFALYPGEYEEKWGVDRRAMTEKVRALDRYEAGLIEIWAVAFWGMDLENHDIEGYLAGKIRMDIKIGAIAGRLVEAADLLESTRKSFKSGPVAQARTIVDKCREELE